MAGKHLTETAAATTTGPSKKKTKVTPEADSLIDEVLAGDVSDIEALTSDLRSYRKHDFDTEIKNEDPDNTEPKGKPARKRRRKAKSAEVISKQNPESVQVASTDSLSATSLDVELPIQETADETISTENVQTTANFDEDSSISVAAIPVANVSHHGEAPQKESRVGRAVGAIFGTATLALLGTYVAGSVFFMTHFMPNTTLDGKDVSLESIQSVTDDINAELDSYTTHLTGNGYDVIISSQDAGLAMDTATMVEDIHKQRNPFTWPAELFKTGNLVSTRVATVDEEKLTSFLTPIVEQYNEEATEPIDATMDYNAELGKFAVIPEVLGTKVDVDALLAHVKDAMSNLVPSVEVDESCLALPAITQDNERLQEAAEAANRFMVGPLTLNIPGGVTDELSADTIRSWIELDDNLDATFHEEEIVDWARHDFSEGYDTVGTERTYTRSDGKVITVSGGEYGWNVNGTDFAAIIADRINSGSSEPIDVPFYSTAAVHALPGEADWGDTYVDLDLTEQHVRYYQAGELVWESDCVTGNTSDDHATPTGVYITNDNRGTNQELIGLDENHDGEPDYKSHVDYWMPFIGNAFAFHDADWRYSFGGDIYTYSGSHGCVNLPVDKAAELYGILPSGVPVVSHW